MRYSITWGTAPAIEIDIDDDTLATRALETLTAGAMTNNTPTTATAALAAEVLEHNPHLRAALISALTTGHVTTERVT